MPSSHLLTRPAAASLGSGHLVRSSRANTLVSSCSAPTTTFTSRSLSPSTTRSGSAVSAFRHQQTRNHFVAVMTLPPVSAGSRHSGIGSAAMAGRLEGSGASAREASTDSLAKSSGGVSSTEGVKLPQVSVATEVVGFEISSIPKNPLGEGRCIRTAAALVIGDEILNGKTMEKNSHYFAKYCFDHGIELKRVEVIPDDEQEIVEASRRMVRQYDFVITTGGIGPTHDDITYASLARAFGQNLAHHSETLRRLDEMNRHRAWAASQNSQQRAATQRMALFPEKAEVLFVGRDIWVPVVRLEGKLCVFPGIPALFQKMLNGLTRFLPLPPAIERPLRIQVFTERPESMIAPYLTSLQARLKPHNIQVGSYPVLGKGVFVSLIGRDRPCATSSVTSEKEDLESKTTSSSSPPSASTSPDQDSSSGNKKTQKGQTRTRIWLAEVACEVEREIGGRIVSEEEVAMKKEEARRSDPDGVAAASVQSQSQKGSPSEVSVNSNRSSSSSSLSSVKARY